MRSGYQKRAWSRNRNIIIQLLSKEKLTFSELISKSGLSRGVVNNHLSALEKDGIVKKVYEKPKILNVLQVAKINLTEWVLSQLENFDVPQEILNKGRKILSQHIILKCADAYTLIWKNIVDILGSSKEFLGENTSISKEAMTLFSFAPVSPRLKTPNFCSFEGKEQEDVRQLLSELNPQVLTFVLTEYWNEKKMLEFINEEKIPEKIQRVFLPQLFRDMKESLDMVAEWWVREVAEYLPSSGFMQMLTFIYSNALSRRLQTTIDSEES